MSDRSNFKHKKQADMAVDTAMLTIRPLKEDDWPIIVELFGEKGACGGCWCMWWRLPSGGKSWEQSKGQKNRNSLQQLLEAGKIHSVMAFSGEKAVGWCSFGPRKEFPRLVKSRALQSKWSDGTWSIVCFYVLPQWRTHGIATRLLEAATARSFALGALEVQGYP